MDKVAISFIFRENEYKGELQKVAGANSSSTWHLMIDNFFCGRLCKADKWVFDSTPKTKKFEHMAEHFGRYITAIDHQWMQPLLEQLSHLTPEAVLLQLY